MDLRALAELTVNFGMKQLREGHPLRVMASVFTENDEIHVMVDNGTVQQDAFILAVRQMVKDHRAQAVCFVADTFLTVVTNSEANHRITHGEHFSVAELLARKWAKRREAIVCTVESPGAFAMFNQFYRRNSEGAIILEEMEQKQTTEHAVIAGSGRTGVFRFFDPPQETVQ